MAAGSVRQLDPKIAASRGLNSFVYDIIGDFGLKTHKEKHAMLHKLGFKTNIHNRSAKNLKEIFEFRDYWEKHRDKLSYEIDGVVAIINDNKIFESAGVVGKAPRAAVAYKFSPKEAVTVIEDVKIQIGRTGSLTPVAILKPVEVGGIKISRATLHNYDQIKKSALKSAIRSLFRGQETSFPGSPGFWKICGQAKKKNLKCRLIARLTARKSFGKAFFIVVLILCVAPEIGNFCGILSPERLLTSADWEEKSLTVFWTTD